MGYRDYSIAKGHIVDATGHGDFTTIQSAITAASSGQTVCVRPGTYPEDLIHKAGVNVSAFICDAETPNVTIIGNNTFTGTGTVSISGIRLQTNSAALLTVSGSNASVVNLCQCYLNCTNNTGISFSSSSSSSLIFLQECYGDLGTTGIALISSSSAGNVRVFGGIYSNSGGSTTANSFSGGGFFPFQTNFSSPFSFTGATAVMTAQFCSFVNTTLNATALTFDSTAAAGGALYHCNLFSGTASAISVGAGASLIVSACDVQSSNTNAITGAGTVIYTSNTFNGTSSTINTTTQTPRTERYGISQSSLQPAFLATHTVAQNDVTGNGANATVNFTTEIFDQNSNYDGTNTFTAPVTGRYRFNVNVFINDAATSTNGIVSLITSNRSYGGTATTPFPLAPLDTYSLNMGTFADMDAGDTCVAQVMVSGMAGNTADIPALASNTYFGGNLVC